MSKISQGKRQRLKQVENLRHGVFDGMKPEQIISAAKSGKLNIERLITHGEIPILPLAQHFNIDTRQLSTGAIKYQVIDAIQDTIAKPSHKSK